MRSGLDTMRRRRALGRSFWGGEGVLPRANESRDSLSIHHEKVTMVTLFWLVATNRYWSRTTPPLAVAVQVTALLESRGKE